jgi:hypothetical protein
MKTVKYRDFARKPKDYIGKRFDIVGRTGVIARVFPPMSDEERQTKERVSDNKVAFKELKEKIQTPACPTGGEVPIDDVNFLKLRGERPLDLNEYIDESTGELSKHSCSFCGTDKILIKMNPDGNNICLNCSPSIKAFGTYKDLVEYSLKSSNCAGTISNQVGFDGKVRAMPKPVKKKKR